MSHFAWYQGAAEAQLLAVAGDTLVIQEASHSHTADNLVLTQVHSLVVQEAAHAHSADNINLVVDLVIAEALHAHAADSLVLTQVHSLVIQEASHAHTADGLTLTQVHQLVVQDAAHSHAVDNLLLAQVHALVVQEASHLHAADNLILVVPAAPARYFFIRRTSDPAVSYYTAASAAALPTVGVVAGSLGYAANDNTLHIYSGSTWS